MNFNDHTLAWNAEFASWPIYTPSDAAGFVAWVTSFSYGDGSVGLSFDEVKKESQPDYRPPVLGFAEAAGIPVSYASVECENAGLRSYRVYMKTEDGLHFYETGRCPRHEASFCHLAFPDGRIVGLDVPKKTAEGKGWSDFIRLRESLDGGSSWRDSRLLLKGSAPYLWRAKRLRDGSQIVLASFYGTPWGSDRRRLTRNTLLPGETYLSKIQSFFLTTTDGLHYSEPHYILPALGAHEYDFVELEDGSLLFVAGDVQGTPVGRQFVRRTEDGWINEAVLPIKQGAPERPEVDPQSGYVPETLAWSAALQCIVGYRRNKCFSVSNDFGENWYALSPPHPFEHLYQPVLQTLGADDFLLLGHRGGDVAFGQCEMSIKAQRFALGALKIPQATRLLFEREFSAEKEQFINAFRARLLAGEQPLAGQTLVFRFTPYWGEGGEVNTRAQALAPFTLTATTDAEGDARAAASYFDGIGDLYFSYHADVIFAGTAELAACSGALMTVLALTPRRRCRFPYDAYFAEGVLFLAPQFVSDFPQALAALGRLVGDDAALPPQRLPQAAVARLRASGVLEKDDQGDLRWRRSIHAPRVLDAVKVMTEGDWYD